MMTNPEKHSATLSPENTFLFGQDDMDRFIRSLIKKFNVYGPVSQKYQTVFDKIEKPENIEWDYEPTVLPPKKYLHRPFETLFSFEDGGETLKEIRSEEKQILFGLRPCDINAINILDTVFTGEYEDPYYVEKRNNSILIALSCSDVFDTCYCTSFDTGPWLEEGYDLLVTQLGDRFLIETGSSRGQELIAEHGEGEQVEGSLLKEYSRLKMAKMETIEDKIKKDIDTTELHKLLEVNVEHPVWDELKEDCLACGSCTIVCPTCFCFNVIDKVDLSLTSGKRQRVWDSCMLLEFAEVALGINFREERAARIKQRIYHKLYSFEYQYDMPGCVGCGRCIKFCIKDIDPRDIIQDLRGEESES